MFVVVPPGDCVFDVFLLALLNPATEQDHKNLAILAEVNSIARSKIQLVFVNAAANSLCVRKITQSNPRNGRSHFGGSLGIEAVEPFSERTASTGVEVFADFDHAR